jgi:hypothetical protein
MMQSQNAKESLDLQDQGFLLTAHYQMLSVTVLPFLFYIFLFTWGEFYGIISQNIGI